MLHYFLMKSLAALSTSALWVGHLLGSVTNPLPNSSGHSAGLLTSHGCS